MLMSCSEVGQSAAHTHHLTVLSLHRRHTGPIAHRHWGHRVLGLRWHRASAHTRGHARRCE